MARRIREISSTERTASIADTVRTFDAFCDGTASLAALKRSFRAAEARGNSIGQVVRAICHPETETPEALLVTLESDVLAASSTEQ